MAKRSKKEKGLEKKLKAPPQGKPDVVQQNVQRRLRRYAFGFTKVRPKD